MDCVARQVPLSMKFSSGSFSKGSSQPRDRTWFSRIAGGFFTVWATTQGLVTSKSALAGGLSGPGLRTPAAGSSPEGLLRAWGWSQGKHCGTVCQPNFLPAFRVWDREVILPSNEVCLGEKKRWPDVQWIQGTQPRGSQEGRRRPRVFTVLCVSLHIQEYLQTGRCGDPSVLYRLMWNFLGTPLIANVKAGILRGHPRQAGLGCLRPGIRGAKGRIWLWHLQVLLCTQDSPSRVAAPRLYPATEKRILSPSLWSARLTGAFLFFQAFHFILGCSQLTTLR